MEAASLRAGIITSNPWQLDGCSTDAAAERNCVTLFGRPKIIHPSVHPTRQNTMVITYLSLSQSEETDSCTAAGMVTEGYELTADIVGTLSGVTQLGSCCVEVHR
ncbi:unannotated protein [freshwater metagenome]|uniref:Unannotated protein n=1 Tax=freshwater metagenome TaxID=449393 RepID=A0A6J7RT42_9ZZZZ